MSPPELAFRQISGRYSRCRLKFSCTIAARMEFHRDHRPYQEHCIFLGEIVLRYKMSFSNMSFSLACTETPVVT